jgi:hypothetical protein
LILVIAFSCSFRSGEGEWGRLQRDFSAWKLCYNNNNNTNVTSTKARFEAAPKDGKLRRFKEFFDGAASWSRVERIIARVEVGAEGSDTRFRTVAEAVKFANGVKLDRSASDFTPYLLSAKEVPLHDLRRRAAFMLRDALRSRLDRCQTHGTG